jgi:hypothetical protein
VIFGYNRPDHLGRVLEALRKDPQAQSTCVEIFLDGPKTVWDRFKCWRVWLEARKPRQFAQITVYRSKKNKGLARSVTQGIRQVLKKADAVIVLEDDIMPLPGFLAFMNGALNRYRCHRKVMQVSAFAYPVPGTREKASFLPLTSCWGWGTWRRAWRHYGLVRKQATKDLASTGFLKTMDLDGSYPYSKLLQDVVDKKSDTWGVIWYWNFLRQRGLALFPPQSYVQNIGWDGSGTHGDLRGYARQSTVKTRTAAVPHWPRRVETDRFLLEKIRNLFRKTYSPEAEN